MTKTKAKLPAKTAPPVKTSGRPRLNPDRVMTDVERVARSESQRRERGEKRLTSWISPEAAEKLEQHRAAMPDHTEGDILSAAIMQFKRK